MTPEFARITWRLHNTTDLPTAMDFSSQSLDLNNTKDLRGPLNTERAKNLQEAFWNTVKSCWDNMGH